MASARDAWPQLLLRSLSADRRGHESLNGKTPSKYFYRLNGYVSPSIALYLTLVFCWKRYGVEGRINEIWDMIAYATRYGRATLTEALRLPEQHSNSYLSAIARIIEKENGPSGLGEK
jgi:hypothetical protein